MVALKLDLVFFLNIFYVSECARRIKDGELVSTEKRYIVYLVKAPSSDKLYDAWVCGGALVSTLFIVTSAACVDDVEFMYAIAGYKKYVKDEDIENDECTKVKKKRVVYTCIPLKYELHYDKIEKWSYIDIALVKVESPYDLEDESYKKICSYIPKPIPINFEDRFQKSGTDGLVLGWGHTEQWRNKKVSVEQRQKLFAFMQGHEDLARGRISGPDAARAKRLLLVQLAEELNALGFGATKTPEKWFKPDDSLNYNQEMLRYASIRILAKEECKKRYESFPNMGSVIDKYMICTLEKGELDENGQMVGPQPKPLLNGCQNKLRLLSDDGEPCDNDLTRRNVLRSNKISNNFNIAQKNRTKNRNIVNETYASRKSGICQNDHGGPLVTWVGAKEVLIGVASVFIVSDDSKCKGPYLYTSTHCNGAFLDCILSSSKLPDKKGRRAICDSPPVQRGYDTVERYISWENHPAGAADNEALARENNLSNKFNSNSDQKNAGVSEALEEFKQLELYSGNETIRLRPQRPLEK